MVVPKREKSISVHPLYGSAVPFAAFKSRLLTPRSSSTPCILAFGKFSQIQSIETIETCAPVSQRPVVFTPFNDHCTVHLFPTNCVIAESSLGVKWQAYTPSLLKFSFNFCSLSSDNSLHSVLCSFQCFCWHDSEQYLKNLQSLHCLNGVSVSFTLQYVHEWDKLDCWATPCPLVVAASRFPEISCTPWQSVHLNHI